MHGAGKFIFLFLVEPISPARKPIAALMNPFVTHAFSPTKTNSFKDISKMSFLAQFQPAVVRSPPTDKAGGAAATKFRSPFTAMLTRRSTLKAEPASPARVQTEPEEVNPFAL